MRRRSLRTDCENLPNGELQVTDYPVLPLDTGQGIGNQKWNDLRLSQRSKCLQIKSQLMSREWLSVCLTLYISLWEMYSS